MGQIKNYLDTNGLQYLWNKIVSKLSHYATKEEVPDIQVNGTSILDNGIANIDLSDYPTNSDIATLISTEKADILGKNAIGYVDSSTRICMPDGAKVTRSLNNITIETFMIINKTVVTMSSPFSIVRMSDKELITSCNSMVIYDSLTHYSGWQTTSRTNKVLGAGLYLCRFYDGILTCYYIDYTLPYKVGDLNTKVTTLQNAGFITSSDLNTALADYVTDTDLNTALADYVTSTDLASTLADYLEKTDLVLVTEAEIDAMFDGVIIPAEEVSF